MAVLPIALALMGAGVKRRYDKDKADEARQAEEDAARREDRDYIRGERQRVQTMRRDIADAAAPVAVEPNMTHGPEMDDRDVGTPGAVLVQDGYRVGQARMGDRAAADQAAAAANDPKARTARMAGALEKHGEIDKAASVRANARQEEVADLQLDELKAKKLEREYDRALYQVPDTHDAVASFISDTKGDGQGGAVKAKAVLSPDGKSVTYHQVNADGSTAPTPYTFPNTREGVITAKFMLSRGIGAKDKLDHLLSTAKTDEERQRWEKEFGLRKSSEERRATHEQRMLTMAERSAAAAERGTAGAVATPDATFDAKTAADIAKEQVNAEAAAARDAGTPWTGAQIARRTDEIVQSLRQSHAARFIEETVARSLNAAQADPAQYAQAYAKAVQIGLPAQKLAQMGFKPPAAAAAQLTPAATPAAVAPAPAAAPAAAPRAPGAQTKAEPAKTGAEQFADMLATNITTPQGKTVIAQHVRTRLPAIQSEIEQHSRVMAMPLVSGPVKAKLKEKIDALAQEAQMMQAFIDGNPGV